MKRTRALRADDGEALGQGGPGEARHDHVGQQEVDRARVAHREAEGLLAAPARTASVAVRLQHLAGERADRRLVLDHQDRLAAGRRRPRRGARLAAPRPAPRRTAGRIRKHGALARRALDRDVPAALLHDAVDRGEAEAGAPLPALGREERLEDLGARRPRPCRGRCRAPSERDAGAPGARRAGGLAHASTSARLEGERAAARASRRGRSRPGSSAPARSAPGRRGRGPRSGSSRVTTLDVLAEERPQHAAPCPTTSAFRSTTCGSITCLRLKARSWRARRAARSAGAHDVLHLAQPRVVRRRGSGAAARRSP